MMKRGAFFLILSNTPHTRTPSIGQAVSETAFDLYLMWQETAAEYRGSIQHTGFVNFASNQMRSLLVERAN
mgnify:CR=1 FL=1